MLTPAIRLCVALACVLGFEVPAVAQPLPPPPPDATADSFTLSEALVVMARSHPLFEASRARLSSAEQQVLAAGLWTNPLLSALYTRSVGFTTFDPIIGSVQVGVTQQIETASVPSARRRVAEFERDAVRSEGEARRRELVFDAHEAFVALAAAHAKLEVQRAALAHVAQAAAVIEVRVAAGVVPHYDQTRMNLALATLRASLGDAEAAVAVARTRLDVAVGPGARTLAGVPQYALFAQPTLPAATELLPALGETRFDLRAAANRVSAAQASIDVAQRSVLPGIALYGGVAVGQGYGPNDERQVDLLAGITIPLPVANRGQSAILAATALADASRREAEALRIEARQRLLGALRETEFRRATEAGFANVETEAQQAIDEAEVLYREGRVPIQGLVDALMAARDARLQRIELSAAARSSEVGLWRAAGRLPDAR